VAKKAAATSKQAAAAVATNAWSGEEGKREFDLQNSKKNQEAASAASVKVQVQAQASKAKAKRNKVGAAAKLVASTRTKPATSTGKRAPPTAAERFEELAAAEVALAAEDARLQEQQPQQPVAVERAVAATPAAAEMAAATTSMRARKAAEAHTAAVAGSAAGDSLLAARTRPKFTLVREPDGSIVCSVELPGVTSASDIIVDMDEQQLGGAAVASTITLTTDAGRETVPSYSLVVNLPDLVLVDQILAKFKKKKQLFVLKMATA
jgi:HSP20 family molecular chaperone IbpA